MSSADEILFEPIGIVKTVPIQVYQPMLDAVAHALGGLQDYQFRIEPDVPIEVYNHIADMVENDSDHISYVKTLVAPAYTHRPANALSIRDVFARIQRGEVKFWYTGKISSGNMTREFKFDNYFSFLYRRPCLRVQTANTLFEWWAVSLLSSFAGYGQHYAFGTEAEARKYHSLP